MIETKMNSEQVLRNLRRILIEAEDLHEVMTTGRFISFGSVHCVVHDLKFWSGLAEEALLTDFQKSRGCKPIGEDE